MTKKEQLYCRVSLFSPLFTLGIVFLLVLLGIFFWYFGHVTERDEKEYQQLMTDAESSQSSTQSTPYTARQDRQGIQKDMFFQRGANRLHIRLTADQAQLVLDHQDAHTYVVEHMQKVKCIMQEELYYLLSDGREALPQLNGQVLLRSANAKDQAAWLPLDTSQMQAMEIIRVIEANQAEYHYKDDRFLAHDVKISRFSMPGHQIKEINVQNKPLMKGSAEKVEFSLKDKDKDLNFKAHHLKARFFDIISQGIN